jgi:hypothetical protein
MTELDKAVRDNVFCPRVMTAVYEDMNGAGA